MFSTICFAGATLCFTAAIINEVSKPVKKIVIAQIQKKSTQLNQVEGDAKQ